MSQALDMLHVDTPSKRTIFVAWWICRKLKHQVRGQFLSRDKFHVTLVVTLYHDCKTSKCYNRCIFSLTTYEVLRHAASFFLHSSGIL